MPFLELESWVLRLSAKEISSVSFSNVCLGVKMDSLLSLRLHDANTTEPFCISKAPPLWLDSELAFPYLVGIFGDIPFVTPKRGSSGCWQLHASSSNVHQNQNIRQPALGVYVIHST